MGLFGFEEASTTICVSWSIIHATRSVEKRSWLYRTRSCKAGNGDEDRREALAESRATKIVRSVVVSVEVRKCEEGASGVL
jgi:hypothetical protein